MSNDMTVSKNTLPAEYDDIFAVDNLNDLTEGAGGGFAVLSIRGGKWRIKQGGEETVVTDGDGDPVASVPVVLVKANPNVSKIFYVKNYEEGDAEEPDCYSLDGVAPDAGAKDPQSGACATCPMNQWGSRITDSGKKAKRCSDNRRVAVVPAVRKGAEADPDILRNVQYDGPMLLRIPPASLKDMVKYANILRSKVGENYNAVVTVLGFDTDVSFPKLTFKATRRLSDEEKEVIVEFYRSGVLGPLLDSAPEIAEAVQAPKAEKQATIEIDLEEDEPMEQEAAPDPQADEIEVEAKPVRKKAVAKKAAAKKGNGSKPVAKKEAAEEVAEEVTSGSKEMDEGLDNIFNELEGF